ncbi:MAG: hypothetical protein R3F42_02390 [Pseudomonadota bacterium]
MKRHSRARAPLILAGTGLLYCLHAAAAPDTSIAAQLEQLQQEVHDLANRVRQLEGMPCAGDAAGQAAVTTAVAPTAAPDDSAIPAPVSNLDPALQSLGRLKAAWHGVSTGMDQAQIHERLGDPSRRFTIDGKPVWYYDYPGVGSGSVLFAADGGAIGVQHPPWRLW